MKVNKSHRWALAFLLLIFAQFACSVFSNEPVTETLNAPTGITPQSTQTPEPTPTLDQPASRFDNLQIIEASNVAELVVIDSVFLGQDSRIVWSPDEKTLAAAAGNDIALYHLESPDAPLQILQGHTYPVNTIAFFPNGAPLASVSQDGTLRFWDTLTGSELSMLDLSEAFTYALWADWVSYSPDGTQIATFAGQDSTLYIWEAINLGTTPPVTIPWFDHAGPVANVTISPDWQTMAWVSRGTLQLMDRSGTPIMEPPRFADFIAKLEFTPDSQTLLVQAAETINEQYTTVVVSYNAPSGERLHAVAFDEFARNFIVAPDGQTLAIASDSGITFWNALTGGKIEPFIGLSTIAQFLAISPDGALLVVTDDQGTIQVFSIDDGSLLAALMGKEGINRLTFRERGKLLVAEYYSGMVEFWGVENK